MNLPDLKVAASNSFGLTPSFIASDSLLWKRKQPLLGLIFSVNMCSTSRTTSAAKALEVTTAVSFSGGGLCFERRTAWPYLHTHLHGRWEDWVVAVAKKCWLAVERTWRISGLAKAKRQLTWIHSKRGSHYLPLQPVSWGVDSAKIPKTGSWQIVPRKSV